MVVFHLDFRLFMIFSVLSSSKTGAFEDDLFCFFFCFQAVSIIQKIFSLLYRGTKTFYRSTGIWINFPLKLKLSWNTHCWLILVKAKMNWVIGSFFTLFFFCFSSSSKWKNANKRNSVSLPFQFISDYYILVINVSFWKLPSFY